MQVVLVRNNQIVDAYEGHSIEELESALGGQGGAYYENPEGKPLGALWEEPSLIPEPQAPPVLEVIRAQLDRLREQTTIEYVAQWGDLSKRELWPLLDAEIVRAASETPETINPAQYPAIVGFLAASELPTVPNAVHAAAANLRQHKAQHVGQLRRSELLRERLLREYAALPEAEKRAWDAAAAWAEGVAAWD